MKVIVVDDEFAALNTFLYYVIDKYDIEIKMFMKNPLDCIEYVLKNNVQAAFLDINLAEHNGIELAKKLIEINHNISIIFISGYAIEKEKIKKEFGKNLLGFCDKPYSEEVLDKYIKNILDMEVKHSVMIKTFGSFDLFINERPVKFYSSKSQELLALLVDRNGATVTMGEAISHLWPDYQIEKSKILYRDAVWKLRKCLKENGLDGLVEFDRALLSIHKIYQCDYWDFLKGKIELFNGEYMINYDWSMKTQNRLFTICGNANL